jgi:hypothetical protein
MLMMLIYRVKSKKSTSEAILCATAIKKSIEINENVNKWTKMKFV